MRRQQRVRALPRAIGQNAASSAVTCSTGGPKGHRKRSALLGQKPGRPPRVIATIAWCRPLRRASPRAPASAPFGAISVNAIAASLPRAAELAFDAGRSGKAAVEQRQALDPSAVHGQRCVDRIDAAQRETLKLRFEADPAYLVGEPLAGLKIDRGAGAVESLLSIGADDCADTLLHALAPACLTGRCRPHHSTVIFAD